MPSIFLRVDGVVGLASSSRAACVSEKFQKPSLVELVANGSGGCVYWGGWGYQVASQRARRNGHTHPFGFDASLSCYSSRSYQQKVAWQVRTVGRGAW